MAQLAQRSHATRRELAQDEELLGERGREVARLKEELSETNRLLEQARSDMNTALDAVSQWEQRYVAAAETAKRHREREEQAVRRMQEMQEALKQAEREAGPKEVARRGSSQALVTLVNTIPSQEHGMCTLLSLDTRYPHISMDRGGSVSFGRDETSTLVLDGKDISHRHARIFYEPEFDAEGITADLVTPFVLEDLSSNGVFVNFEKVGNGQRRRLKHGDAVWMSKLACKRPKSTSQAFVFQVLPSRETINVPPWDLLKSGKKGRVLDANSTRTWMPLTEQ